MHQKLNLFAHMTNNLFTYLLLGRITVLHTRTILTDRVAWSVGLSHLRVLQKRLH